METHHPSEIQPNHPLSRHTIPRIIGGLLLLGILFFGIQEGWYQFLLWDQERGSTTSSAISFLIQTGESPSSITKNLADRGLISSDWAFLLTAKRKGLDSQFQAGRFTLRPHTAYSDLAEQLTNAQQKEIPIILREGVTNADIDDVLFSNGLIARGDFLQCVRECDFSEFPFLPSDSSVREGFFFPDTYFVLADEFDVEVFAQRLLRNFDQKTKTLFASGKRNGWEVLKMASIVEKESRNGDERPIVAGILWKRLDNNWMIGADATTRYITGKATEPLTVSDLNQKNPWNTRASKGLPPGAICNPGMSAIRAAAFPESSAYWYYLHGNDGQIRYGTSADEHRHNKRKYL